MFYDNALSTLQSEGEDHVFIGVREWDMIDWKLLRCTLWWCSNGFMARERRGARLVGWLMEVLEVI